MAMDFITVTTQFVAGTKARASEINSNYSNITGALSDASKDIYIGGFAKGIAATNATMVIADDSNISTYIINNTTTAAVVTLPTASVNTGRLLTIKSGGKTELAGKVTLDGEGSETIDGELTIDLLNQYEYVTVQCDGSNWHIVDRDPGRMRLKSSVPNDLDTDHLLNSSDFRSTTNLYGWHGFSGVYADAAAIDTDWIGSEGLKAISSAGITTTTNHLGDDEALDLDGTNDAVYWDTTTADTANENFTVAFWCKLGRTGSNEIVVSKYIGVNTGNSFYINYNAAGALVYDIHYDAAGGTEGLTLNDMDSELVDDGSHHFAIMYESDTAASNMGLYIDGMCRGYKISSNLATRNNTSTSKLTFGGYGNGTATLPTQCQMTDMLYAQTAMSSDDIRKIYAAGSGKKAIESRDNKVSILDSSKNNGHYYVIPTSNEVITATALGTAVPTTSGPGYNIYIPETGRYKVKAQFTVSVEDSNAAISKNYIYTRLTGGPNGTTEIPSAYAQFILLVDYDSESPDTAYFTTLTIEKIIYATKGDLILLQAWKNADTSTATVRTDSNSAESYIMWEKLD